MVLIYGIVCDPPTEVSTIIGVNPVSIGVTYTSILWHQRVPWKIALPSFPFRIQSNVLVVAHRVCRPISFVFSVIIAGAGHTTTPWSSVDPLRPPSRPPWAPSFLLVCCCLHTIIFLHLPRHYHFTHFRLALQQGHSRFLQVDKCPHSRQALFFVISSGAEV